MPAISSKQYKVITAAGTATDATSRTAAPQAPNRTMLLIQNTGANPGLVHFGENVQGDGSDFLVASGASLPLWDQADTTPKEKINLGSAAGTTWAILEQVTRP